MYELPHTVNASNIGIFERFFDSYGDHIVTKCKRMGGMISQLVAVDNEYIIQNSLNKATEQARLSFMNDMNSNIAKYPIDKEFLKAAHFQPVRTFGGRYKFGIDGFKGWV